MVVRDGGIRIGDTVSLASYLFSSIRIKKLLLEGEMSSRDIRRIDELCMSETS